MVMAFDCGAVLNPDTCATRSPASSSWESEGLFERSPLFEDLHNDRREVLNPRWIEYGVPRFADVPEIEVILVDRREVTPAGAGESPITVVAPALGAAIRRATSRRMRALPLT